MRKILKNKDLFLENTNYRIWNPVFQKWEKAIDEHFHLIGTNYYYNVYGSVWTKLIEYTTSRSTFEEAFDDIVNDRNVSNETKERILFHLVDLRKLK